MGPSSVKDRKHAPCRNSDNGKRLPWAGEQMRLQNGGEQRLFIFPLLTWPVGCRPCRRSSLPKYPGRSIRESRGLSYSNYHYTRASWCLSGKDFTCNADDLGSHRIGLSPGGGHGYPLQYLPGAIPRTEE